MLLRILQEPADSGIAQMERDQILLESAEQGELYPTLRFYQWSVPTVSLGLHQKLDLLDLEKLQTASVPWVYRPTGGAAVLHSEELTYAIIFPDTADSARASKVQEFVGRSIANALCKLGINAVLDERGEPLSALPNRNSCFVRTSRWEVTVKGKKLVGSAQRKLRHALLQHGSILTGNDHRRLIDFLVMQNETMRSALRERLVTRSTSISQELNHAVDMNQLRETLSHSFSEEYRKADYGFSEIHRMPVFE